MKKKLWQCEDCGYISGKARTLWLRMPNGNSAGFKVCSKCEGKVKDIS